MTISTREPTLTEETVRGISKDRGEPDWLLERRLAALRAFDAMAMPDPLDEEWRRTDMGGFDFDEALAQTGAPATELIGEDLPRGAVFSGLQEAAVGRPELVQEHLHSIVKPADWKLAALQAASWQGGAFVHVPGGVEVEVPLRYLVRHAGAPAYPHLLIVAEANSSVTVLQETTGGAPQGYSLVSGAVEIICRPDSRVRYVEIEGYDSAGVYNFSTVRARLERGAELSAAVIGLGGRLNKMRLEALLEGEGSRAELLGLTFGNDQQQFDYLTLQDHTGPGTASDLMFKAALTAQASQVWQGTARIHKGASQSEANQTSRNLLLSDKAKAAPIPILEIEAYDVLRCSHGATAGPLDEEQVFYLESRGIPRPEAQHLLVEAFFREVIDRLPSGVDQEALAQQMLDKMGAS